MPHISKPSAYVYGHPKAGRRFEQTYHNFLVKNNWIPSSFDPHSYTLHNDIGSATLLTIVDDSPIMSSSVDMRDFVHNLIGSEFKIVIDNECKHIAGLDIQQNSNNSTTLRQDGACENLFDTWFPEWKTVDPISLPSTPMSSTSRAAPLSPPQQLAANILLPPEDITKIQSQLGSLNWLTHTWPDILFAYKEKAPCATRASQHDANEILRIIKYMVRMYRTNNYGLTIGGSLGVQLLGTVDTSYACRPDLKSISGGTIHMGPEFGSFYSFSSSQSLTYLA
jgi:hypothetical protein